MHGGAHMRGAYTWSNTSQGKGGLISAKGPIHGGGGLIGGEIR